jgi:SpoVK/Ycf46/Vps4 family AAA+-type ATPase
MSKNLKHLWLLRILISLDAHKLFVREKDFVHDDLARELGFEKYVEDSALFNRNTILTALREQLAKIELRPPAITDKSTLWVNVHQLGQTLALSDAEQKILYFSVVARIESHFEECLSSVGTLTIPALEKLFSVCLDLNIADVRAALSESGTLFRTGILMLDFDRAYTFADKVEILRGLSEELLREQSEPLGLFRNNVIPSIAAKLSPDHYPHLADDTKTIQHYLGNAQKTKQAGVNILIHGAPGSGKTEYVRMIAEITQHHLYEVATETRNGKALEGLERFRAFKLAQSILERRNDTVILFDEIEDVFREAHDDTGKKGNQSGAKAWVNRLLETNPVPAFWLTNNVWQLDPAVVRRFDYILEMNAPPRSVRARMLDDYLVGLPVSNQWKRQMAEHEKLVPAVIERAAKVIRKIEHTVPSQELDNVISRVMGNTLEALRLPRMPKAIMGMDTHYRLEILNADCDIEEICENLTTDPRGRLCLYGPPGTGKTAFGRYLAERLDRPLLIKRASDILSPYLGEAEKNMAKMFREAELENAVLLLDEADSYLQDRKQAKRSWEISEVNEMLTQMESFDGLFIASTNLMSSLDAAALRRFDLKLRFDYLKPEQAWLMFTDTITKLGLQLDESLQKAVAALGMLTPGDFAAVTRQSRLRKIADSSDLLNRLTDECAIKPDANKRAIGFSAY